MYIGSNNAVATELYNVIVPKNINTIPATHFIYISGICLHIYTPPKIPMLSAMSIPTVVPIKINKG